MPPGYMYPCPAGYHLPLTQWAPLAWEGAYALWVEATLLALGLLGFRLWRSIPRGGALATLAVVGCALVVVAVALWTDHRNAQLCFYTTARYTPEFGARTASAIAAAMGQAKIALNIEAAAFLIGTFLTVRILVLGWRRRRRAMVAQAA